MTLKVKLDHRFTAAVEQTQNSHLLRDWYRFLSTAHLENRK